MEGTTDKERYEAPLVEVLDMNPEGVVCASLESPGEGSWGV